MTENVEAPFGICPKHKVPNIVTKSGSATLCPNPDCDFVIQHPTVKQESPMKSDKKVLAEVPANADKKAREKAIAEAVAKKTAAKGSVEEKKENATKPGIVKPSKPERKVKIPKELNKGRVDNTDTVTEDDIEDEVDEEIEEVVTKKAKKEKPVDDPNMLSVSDVAKEVGIDPKRARAKLRAAGQTATEGRWPKVKRGSKAHAELVKILTPEPVADDDDEDESDDEDEE